ncbi:four helix bundle protein [soil metagenome]
MVTEVYQMSERGAFARDHGLRDQMRRAAVSVMSNVAEGFERRGNREFVQFLYIAKASAAEVRSQLYVASDLGYLDQSQCARLQEKLTAIARQLSGLIKYLKQAGQGYPS